MKDKDAEELFPDEKIDEAADNASTGEPDKGALLRFAWSSDDLTHIGAVESSDQ